MKFDEIDPWWLNWIAISMIFSGGLRSG